MNINLFIKILLLIIILIMFYYAFNFLRKYNKTVCTTKEYFLYEKIIYLSKEETKEIIISDKDEYFNRFNKLDLIARQSISIEDYKNKIEQICIDFNNQEKQIINNLIKKLDKIENQINELWINKDKLKQIPWKIGLTENIIYENGLPHTRNDTIIINRSQIVNNSKFADTLLHEKLHVYQKLYPEDFDIYLKENNFIKDSLINTYTNTRANPDTDKWIYTQNNKKYICIYNKENPRSLRDVVYEPINDHKYDHPREKAVYDILSKLEI